MRSASPTWWRPSASVVSIPWISIGWLAAALTAGLMIGVLPLPIALAAIGGAALVAVAFLHPAALLVVLLVFAPMRTLIATELPVVFGSGWPLPLDIGQLLAIAFLGAWALHKLLRWKRNAAAARFGWSAVLTPLLIFVTAGALTAFSTLSLGGWLTEWL